MIEELTRTGKTDLLWVGYVLASKIFTSDGDAQWLKGRFALMNDFLWDSPIYQEIIGTAEAKGRVEGEAQGMAKGEAKGRAEGVETGKLQALFQIRLSLVNLVNARFPALRILAQQCTQATTDNAALLQVQVLVGSSQTEQEAEQVLRTLLLA